VSQKGLRLGIAVLLFVFTTFASATSRFSVFYTSGPHRPGPGTMCPLQPLSESLCLVKEHNKRTCRLLHTILLMHKNEKQESCEYKRRKFV